MDEFYKFVPRECLPVEHGGPLESVEVYSSEYKNERFFLIFKPAKHILCGRYFHSRTVEASNLQQKFRNNIILIILRN